MRSSDFPATVEPRAGLKNGGPPRHADLTVVMPIGRPGALGVAAQHPAISLMQEVHTTTAAVQDLMRRLQAIPGINQQTFQQGAQLMLQGFQLIGASMPKQQ